MKFLQVDMEFLISAADSDSAYAGGSCVRSLAAFHAYIQNKTIDGVPVTAYFRWCYFRKTQNVMAAEDRLLHAVPGLNLHDLSNCREAPGFVYVLRRTAVHQPV